MLLENKCCQKRWLPPLSSEIIPNYFCLNPHRSKKKNWIKGLFPFSKFFIFCLKIVSKYSFCSRFLGNFSAANPHQSPTRGFLFCWKSGSLRLNPNKSFLGDKVEIPWNSLFKWLLSGKTNFSLKSWIKLLLILCYRT